MTVTPPRTRIRWLMAGVAIVALEFGAIRVVADFKGRSYNPTIESLAAGGLPTANILAFFFLVSRQQRRLQPFLVGFVTFGALALAVFVALCFVGDGALMDDFLRSIDKPWDAIAGRLHTDVFNATRMLVDTLMLVLPQLAFAVIGGLLLHAVNVTRRLHISRASSACTRLETPRSSSIR